MSITDKRHARYNKKTVDLIRAFESQDLLWNKTNPRYACSMARKAAYTAIANAMEMQKRDVKMKIRYLTGWFRFQKRQKTGYQRWWTPYMRFYESHCHEENKAGTSNNNNNNNNAEATATEDGNDSSSVDPMQQTVEQQNDSIIEIIDDDSIDLFALLDAPTAYDYFTSASHLFMDY